MGRKFPRHGPGGLDEHDELRISRLHSYGWTQDQVCQAIPCSRLELSRLTREHGWSWATPDGRERGAAAVRARAVLRRAEMREYLLRDAAAAQQQVLAPQTSTTVTPGGKVVEVDLDRPSPADQLRYAQTVDTMLRAVERLDRADAESPAAAGAVVTGLVEALVRQYGGVGADALDVL